MSLQPQGQYGGAGWGLMLFPPAGFKRKETRGKLAIGITTNFINRHSRAEVEVAEISGVARIYNQKFFQNLYNKTGQWFCGPNPCPFLRELKAQTQDVPSCGVHVPHCRGHLVSEPSAGAPRGPGSALSLSPGIDLENIVYYKDDTHYFVMTAKKQSLLKKGVILQVRRAGSGTGISQQRAAESLERGMQIVDAGLTAHPWGGKGCSSCCLCHRKNPPRVLRVHWHSCTLELGAPRLRDKHHLPHPCQLHPIPTGQSRHREPPVPRECEPGCPP